MKKVLKISLYVLGSIFVLILIAVIWLQTQSGKNFVRKQVISFLETKIKTPFHIGKIDYALPKMLLLEDVWFKDQRNDTLLAAKKLKVNISMLKLINSHVDVQQLELVGVTAHIYRYAPDTAFNFDYIAKAFASSDTTQEEPKQEDTSGSKLKLTVDKVKLDDIHIRFDDYTGGTRFAGDLQTLRLNVKEIDLEKMAFKVKEFTVKGLAATMIADTSYLPPTPPDTSAPSNFNLVLDKLDLQQIEFHQKDELSKFYMDIAVGRLFGHPKEFDLLQQKVALTDLRLDNANIKILMAGVAAEKAEEVADTVIVTEPIAAESKWRVLAKDIDLNNVNFVMDNQSQPRLASGIDYAHLDVRNLVLDVQDVYYTMDTISAAINHFTVQEKSGLFIKELKTKLAYYPQGAYLRDLYLQTSNTILRDYAEVTYPSLDALQNNLQSLKLKINLHKSVVGLKDVLIFVPDLRSQPFFKKYGNERLDLEAAVTGYMNNLDIKKFALSGLGNTRAQLKGKLMGLPDANKLRYDINIAELRSTSSDLSSLLPPAALEQVRLPNSFNITGTVKGTAQDYSPNLFINTSDGNAWLKGYVYMSPGKGKEKYDLNIRTQELNLGRILKQDSTLGKLTAVVTAKGRSFDVKYMDAAVTGNIVSAGFNGYTYSAINFNGNVAGQQGAVNLVSGDPNLRMQLDAEANFANEHPSVFANVLIDSADLQALKLYQEEFKIRANIKADFPVLNPDYPEGDLVINRPTVLLSGQRYFLDSLYITSKPNQDTGNHIIINADAIYATIMGHTPLSQTGNIMQQHISRYYTIKSADSAKAQKSAPSQYDLRVDALVRDRPLMHILLPGLESMDTIGIHASIDPNNLSLTAAMPSMVYSGMTLQNGNVNVKGDGTLQYSATLDRFANSSMELWYASVSGNVSGQTITSDITISDTGKTPRFALSATLQQKENEQVLSLRNGLKLNYTDWNVSQPNQIVFGKDGFYVQNFKISNAGQSIALNSETPTFSAPMTIAINDFLISNLTEIVQKDTLLANGILNSNLKVQNITTTPQVSGSLDIRYLAFKNDTIGNFDLQLQEASANMVTARASVTGNNNNIIISGNYYPTPVNGNNFDLNIDLQAVHLQTFEGLAMHQIKNTSGYIRGNLKVQGTMTAPKVTGELRTDKLITTPTALGSPLNMPAEKISFVPDGIVFENFKIVDEKGNSGTISGKVTTTDYRNMDLALRVRANKWQVLNSTAKDNEIFYGKLIISSNIRINGAPSAPVINGNLTIHDSTKLNIIIPQTDPSIQEREGVVEFVDMDDPDRNKYLVPNDSMPKMAMRAGADLNMNVTVEDNAEFSVIIDQSTGDFLRVRGEAALNTTVNPDGTVGLTGVYELKDGAYELNYNFIKRRFNIKPGSKITFAGDPMEAQVDITAVYTANIPPYDLVEKRVQTDQLNFYKQRIPFDVKLMLSGPLMKPVINFDIELPDERNYRVSSEVLTTTRARLTELRNDASDLNKQVFAVLILNRFIAENPFESGTSTDAAYIARQSVSRFMSEQLNRFANDLVNGLELTFDLQSTEDYTTGQKRDKTDLNVAASKRLLNDRLTITVGNNFELEGQTQTNNENTSLVPGNLAADYQLSPDGRYKVRIYRRNENESMVQAYSVETGVSFIVTLEYNKFKNIFRKRNKLPRADKAKKNDKVTGATQ